MKFCTIQPLPISCPPMTCYNAINYFGNGLKKARRRRAV